jgi:sugar fermentation stimulation protein A
LKLPPLETGVLVRRYKRFLADVTLADGRRLTLHCPNTGAMTGCADPGSLVWFSESANPKRKYPHTLELVETPAGIVSVNTHRANQLVHEALMAGSIEQVQDIDAVHPEAKIPEGDGRFDFSVTQGSPTKSVGQTWIEVKSVTLHQGDGVGAFPDAVSTRALKHVQSLVKRVRDGDRGILLFCAQHCGIDTVRIAGEIDADYAAAVNVAIAAGVEVLAYGCATNTLQMSIDRRLEFICDC